MALVKKTIGTDGRDFVTITAWEAASYGATSSDTAEGEVINDSPFDENPAVLDSTPTDVKLTVPLSSRNDGTAGTGSRIVITSSITSGFIVTFQPGGINGPGNYEWLEIDANGETWAACISSNADNITFGQAIFHGIAAGVNPSGVMRFDRTQDAFDCVIYDIRSIAADREAFGFRGTINVFNCTVHNIRTTQAARDATGCDGQTIVQNTICTDVSGGTTNACFAGSPTTEDHNSSSDGTAAGTGSLTSQASSTIYVSTVIGSEDLSAKSGAPTIRVGIDLGSTPTGVNFGAGGNDRDAIGELWDMGAYQFIFQVPVPFTSQTFISERPLVNSY